MPALPTTGVVDVRLRRMRIQGATSSPFVGEPEVYDWQAPRWRVSVQLRPYKLDDPNFAAWLAFFESLEGMANTFTADFSRYAPLATPPLTLTAGANVTVGADWVEKTSGGAADWDAGAYSVQSYTAGVWCSFRGSSAASHFMAGINSDPSVDDNYTGIDYAWFLRNDGTCESRIAGASEAVEGSYTAATSFGLAYDGGALRWFKDGVTVRTVSAAAGGPLAFDCSINTAGARIENIKLGPYNSAYADLLGRSWRMVSPDYEWGMDRRHVLEGLSFEAVSV